MRLERHDADGQAARAGGFANAREQCLVTAVDTVEIADRQRAGRAAFGIGKTAEDSHDNRRVGGAMPLGQGSMRALLAPQNKRL
jgi:hypothetical protein